MSPSEFVEAVEDENVTALVTATGMPEARAARIIERFDEHALESILSAPIEDGVTLCLLDGKEYKTTEELSTGQRCTVILPLLLRQRPLSLIVDQPEDNLDNGFIVSTVIKAISQSKDAGQLIFATHNANIPVLECRKWAHDVTGRDSATFATAYSFAVRQLKYKGAPQDLAVNIASAAARRLGA